ncbi:killer cell lectin-like receptor subfamily B member 1B allele A [Polypterus senegalus]|uniref:killer cell lectin-like receptor subfamily B member 1B allele A n=1 Tax=Polypterus senegalus TaxID=55291 RepID=UPI00196237C3|nr:killer cell lectin-like receptor subfamily B member 1B allele A [Polypterus senegalus]
MGCGVCLFVAMAVIIMVMALKKSVKSCPEEWMQMKENCYYISTLMATWEYSNDNCSSLGASLTVIEDPKELAFLVRQCRRFLSFWIGLKRTPQMEWRWINNHPFNQSWRSLDATTEGDCVSVSQETLQTQNCSTLQLWICKRVVGP